MSFDVTTLRARSVSDMAVLPPHVRLNRQALPAEYGSSRARRRPGRQRSVWAHFGTALLLLLVACAAGFAFGISREEIPSRALESTQDRTAAPLNGQPAATGGAAGEILLTDRDYGILYREIKRREPEVFEGLQARVADALNSHKDVDTAKLSAQMQMEKILQKYWSNASDPVVFQRLIVDSKLYDHFSKVKPAACVKLWNTLPLGSDSELIPKPLLEQIVSMEVGLLQDYSDNKRPGLSNEQTAAAAGIVWQHVAEETGRDLSIVNDRELQNREPEGLCTVASVFSSAVRTQLKPDVVAPLIRQLTRAMQKTL